ncbi:MAG: GNAT family N-acetyltransferase [Candidatus Yonathbacteria bacterium]|nr:GNAT family N-acetyltransferase [Candidatus Yonathbacteria bacterium]
MKIRDYSENDRDAVQNIFTKYWTDEEFLSELAKNIDERKMRFYVAEKDDAVVGVAGFREAPEYLRVYAETKNPAELYIVASKLQNEGIGSALVQKVVEEAKNLFFTEIECYSPETHNRSWKFYEKLGFTKHGIIRDPDDGYPGMLWRIRN